jgi:hypothetical protein
MLQRDRTLHAAIHVDFSPLDATFLLFCAIDLKNERIENQKTKSTGCNDNARLVRATTKKF